MGIDLEANYRRACETSSDINEHLITLAQLVLKLGAQRVIELGVRSGNSTLAWLYALGQTDGHLWAVDINPAPFEHGRMTFVQGYDCDTQVLIQLPELVDIVFIDTDHRYELTKTEIALYAPRVRPGGCIIFHDVEVETFGHHASGTEPPYPVRSAVFEWVKWNGLRIEQYPHNNGLAVCWV